MFQKKKTVDRFEFLKFFKVNHSIDIPYENDLRGIPQTDPKINVELNNLADLVIVGVNTAKMQSVLIPESGDPNNILELGYVFGCLDASKTLLWNVEDFNRSFFHLGFRFYYGDLDKARTALINLGVAINNNDTEFMKVATIGRSETVRMITEKKQASGLIELFSK